MSNSNPDNTPARTYYTAQELADLALQWGATATIEQHDDDVRISLERHGDSIELSLGRPQEFYEHMFCRGWVFIRNAPHRACDRWNEFPYFGTFSVVYDEHDAPVMTESGFALRGVVLIEFDRAKDEEDIMRQVLLFWFSMSLIQDLVFSGSTDLREIKRMTIPGEVSRWWLGDDPADGDDSAEDEDDE
jgi:hypothetical protein